MHETSLMRNLINITEKTVADKKIKKVNKVYLSVGQMSNALPGALVFAFEALKKDSFLKDAELEIISVPVKFRCLDCNSTFDFTKFPILCSFCSSQNYAIIQGEDVYINSLDCEF